MTKPKKRLTDDDIRNVVHPVHPEDSSKRLRLGLDYTALRPADRVWKRYGLNQQGEWRLYGKCRPRDLVELDNVRRHVDLVQSITVISGVGLVESWTWRTQPVSDSPSTTQRIIDFVSRIAYGMPAVG